MMISIKSPDFWRTSDGMIASRRVVLAGLAGICASSACFARATEARGEHFSMLIEPRVDTDGTLRACAASLGIAVRPLAQDVGAFAVALSADRASGAATVAGITSAATFLIISQLMLRRGALLLSYAEHGSGGQSDSRELEGSLASQANECRRAFAAVLNGYESALQGRFLVSWAIVCPMAVSLLATLLAGEVK